MIRPDAGRVAYPRGQNGLLSRCAAPQAAVSRRSRCAQEMQDVGTLPWIAFVDPALAGLSSFLRHPTQPHPQAQPMLSITVTGNGLVRFHDAVRALGEAKARTAYAKAINNAGRDASKEVAPALTKQTGLPKRTAPKALRRHVVRANAGRLAYQITAQGGDIRLKFFKARETRKGVTAAPWNKRKLEPGTFMRAGWWPKRVAKPNWNRQVFRRTGGTTKFGKDEFENVKSGLFIPEELMKGEASAAWLRGGASLQRHVAFEVKKVTKGAVS